MFKVYIVPVEGLFWRTNGNLFILILEIIEIDASKLVSYGLGGTSNDFISDASKFLSRSLGGIGNDINWNGRLGGVSNNVSMTGDVFLLTYLSERLLSIFDSNSCFSASLGGISNDSFSASLGGVSN